MAAQSAGSATSAWTMVARRPSGLDVGDGRLGLGLRAAVGQDEVGATQRQLPRHHAPDALAPGDDRHGVGQHHVHYDARRVDRCRIRPDRRGRRRRRRAGRRRSTPLDTASRWSCSRARRDGGRKILISGGGRCNILPQALEPARFVSDGPAHLVRHLLRSWPLAEQHRFFEEEVGVR